MFVATEQIIECVNEVEKDEEKLVIVAGKPGSGKSKIMRELGQMRGWKYIDSKVLLTDEFLELPPKARAGEAPNVMSDVLAIEDARVILLDNTQALFAPVLRTDPLQLLRQLSRKQTIVAAWPGEYTDKENEPDEKALVYLRNFGTEAVYFDSEGLKIISLP